MANSIVLPELTAVTPVDDAAELAASSLHSEEAFRAFYERTSRSLWAYLKRLTGNGHAADDLLQETYYRFYRAAGTYESERHRRNALFTIATNLARDAHRRTHGMTSTTIEEETAVTRADDAETRTDVARALARLKPLQRELLLLAYAHGSSHEEIAAATGVAPASVKTLLFRARKKLAALLGRTERKTR